MKPTSTSESRPIAVVGAGFSGLSAACHLQSLGHTVEIFEGAEAPGGRAGSLSVDGHRFDTGPTVITMPDLVAQTFAAVGAKMEDFCDLTLLDPAYRANFADGSGLSLTSDTLAMADRIGEFAGSANADGYQRFVKWTTELFDAEFGVFIDDDVSSVLRLARQYRPLLSLVRLGGFKKWSRRTADFFPDERLQKLFSFQAMYAGLSPLEALGLFAVIAHMDTVQGVYSASGGVHAISTGLADAATKAGVKIHYGHKVAGVDTDRSHPVLRFADGSSTAASAVVMSADLPVAYKDLLGTELPFRARRSTFSPSCLVWLAKFGGDLPADTAHHNVHFGPQWDGAFDDLLKRGIPMREPSRFVTVGSVSDPSAAPANRHSGFVLEPVPSLDHDIDWMSETPRLTDRMLGWANQSGYDLSSADLVDTVDPLVWRARGAAAGTPFSYSHRFSQSGPFRADHQDSRLPGVVFTGSGTRPGVGIPMVLISGRLAAARADDYVRNH